MSWSRRLWNLLRPNRLARDIDRELEFHLAEEVDALTAQGLTEDAARREARRRFGNRVELRERVQRVDVVGWLDTLAADLRHAIRGFRAHPGFTIVAVASLGLGIGANTSIFSLINAVVLRALPVERPEELVRIRMTDGNTSLTNPLWEAIHTRAAGLAGTFAVADQPFNLAAGGVVRRVQGAWVSGDYFTLLGVRAARGRVLRSEDDVRGCPGVAVLSDGFWQREYGGDPSVIGRSIPLDGHPFTIIGVSEEGFTGIHVGRTADVVTPLCTIDIVREGRGMLDARSTWFLTVFGRLRPQQPLAEAQAALEVISPGVFEATVPTHWSPDEQREYLTGRLTADLSPTGVSAVRARYSQALVMLLVVVAVVLLIACANVAQLLLARATSRSHELAIRVSLGAGRARLARQLLTESLLLSLTGAAVGIVFARWSSTLLVRLLSRGGSGVTLDLSLDGRVLGFTLLVAVVTGVLFGIAPAWRTGHVDPQWAMRASGRGVVGDPRQRVARGIVVGQIALCLVLVTAAGLLVGSFRRLTSVDLGFRRDGVLVASADWQTLGLTGAGHATLVHELLAGTRALPGVRRAGAARITPISGPAWNDYVAVDGYTPATQRDALVWFNFVSDGYLETMGIDLVAGRGFSDADRAGGAPVVVVNQEVARHFFAGASPLGRHLRITVHDSLGPPLEIVGVMADGKYRTPSETTLPTALVPLAQREDIGSSIELVLRTEGDPSAMIPAVTEAIRRINPAISLEFTTLREQVDNALSRPRTLALLSGFFGGLALLLAVIGLYGTISYSVLRRQNEIGVRIALGAGRNGILRMVAGEAGRVIVLGVVLGTGLTVLATRIVSAFLYGVTATDPTTLLFSAAILAVVATVAGLVPAWRAARVDPMVALREE